VVRAGFGSNPEEPGELFKLYLRSPKKTKI